MAESVVIWRQAAETSTQMHPGTTTRRGSFLKQAFELLIKWTCSSVLRSVSLNHGPYSAHRHGRQPRTPH
eukprot:3614126-Amphidinium_carterae.1